MALFEECLEALSNDAKILRKEESETITKELQAFFPFSNKLSGKIFWRKVHHEGEITIGKSRYNYSDL